MSYYPHEFGGGLAIVGDQEWTQPKKVRYKQKNLYDNDIDIEIEACAICGSDVHCSAGRWGQIHFPMIPGHEIVGSVVKMGKSCSKFNLGQRVGVGAIVLSCFERGRCKMGEENYCSKLLGTYNYK
jgi:alcohol dehydrogenase (NADP+)